MIKSLSFKDSFKTYFQIDKIRNVDIVVIRTINNVIDELTDSNERMLEGIEKNMANTIANLISNEIKAFVITNFPERLV